MGPSPKPKESHASSFYLSDAISEKPERLLETLLETAAQAILAIDEGGRIVLANATFESMFGYSRQEILGRPLETLLPERVREQHLVRRAAWALQPRNRPTSEGLDVAAVRKGGEEFPVEISLSHMATEDGTLAVAFVTDITERRRNEEALRESEARLSLAQQVSRVGTFEWNIQTGVNVWTRELEAMYGLPPGGFAGTQQTWEELIHPDDRSEAVRRVQEAMVSGDFEGEWRVTWPDGTVRWLVGRGSVLRDASGKPLRLIGINMDITDRKRALDELRESNDRFRNMADHAPVKIWVSGPDKLCTFFNKRWLDFVGRTMEQELGYGWTQGVHPEDLDRCFDMYSCAFDERRNFQMEYRLRRKDGEYRWVFDSGVPRVSEDDAFAGYIGSCVDITEMKRTQEQVFHAQKLESLDVLAGGIAHDFNNLLGAILSQTESLLLDLVPGSPGLEEAENIRGVAVRAATIVRQLMAYAGKESAAFEAVNLGRVIGEVLELLKVSISKKANLKIHLAEDLPAVRANVAQLHQVVLNLITNASEALGEGEGVITIATSQLHIAGTSPGSGDMNLRHGGYIRLQISDTGCGMPKDIQTRIFDPFFTTKSAGHGLGLAAVQGIIRNHGGAISLASSPGEGSCFTILLPSTPETVAQSAPAAITSQCRKIAVPTSILVIEDEDMLRVSVSALLRKKGFSVFEAADGQAALDLFQAHGREIGVVLLDSTLPGLPGREVLRRLRQLRSGLKVILTTAYSQGQVMTAIGEQPVSAFIRKPYGIADLTDLIRKVLTA